MNNYALVLDHFCQFGSLLFGLNGKGPEFIASESWLPGGTHCLCTNCSRDEAAVAQWLGSWSWNGKFVGF